MAFGQEAIDTLYTPEGTMILYSNRTWEYLEDRDFDGVMNDFLHSYFEEDTTYQFSYSWDHDLCYTSNKSNDLTQLKDTLWICVVDSSYNKFVLPFDGNITSRYGYRKGRYHNGIDIDLETGDTVVAAFTGKVRYAQYNDSGFGNLVIIRHYNGLETFYAHLSKLLVVPNQKVTAGDIIGLGGNTGKSYGSHLHFETRFYDAAMNPEEVIDFKTGELRDENLFIHKGLFRPGASVSSPNSNQSANHSNVTYHKVRSGDTLGAIARKYGTTVSKICQLNGIKSTTILAIGRSLRVR